MIITVDVWQILTEQLSVHVRKNVYLLRSMVMSVEVMIKFMLTNARSGNMSVRTSRMLPLKTMEFVVSIIHRLRT